MPFSDQFIFLMIPFVIVSALLYIGTFDSRPEPEYPDVPVFAQLVDGVFRVILTVSASGWIALVIALFCEITGIFKPFSL